MSPVPPRRRRPRHAVLGASIVALLLAACGGAPPVRHGPTPSDAPLPLTSTSEAIAGVFVDVTARPGTALVAALVAFPVPPEHRAAARAVLAARASRLGAPLDALGGAVSLETVGGAPALKIDGPAPALAALLQTLEAELRAAPPAPVAVPPPEVPGDKFDALGPGSAPSHPVVAVVAGDEGPELGRLVAAVGAEHTRLNGSSAGRQAGGDLQSSPGRQAGGDLQSSAGRQTGGVVRSPKSAPSRQAVQVLRRGGGLARLALGWDLLAGSSAAEAALLGAVLAGGPDARLPRAFAAADMESPELRIETRRGADGPRLVLLARVPPNEAEAAWRLAIPLVQGAARSPVTGTELARARAFLSDSAAFERETTPGLLLRRATGILAHDAPAPAEGEADNALDATTAADVTRVADGLRPETFRGLLVTPDGDTGVDDGLWAESLAEVARTPPGRAVGAPEVRPGVVALADGFSVLVHPRPADAVVAFELRVGGGANAEPLELPGAGALAAALVGRPAEALGFPIAARLERDAIAVSVSVPAERWQEGLQLLARRVRRLPAQNALFEDARGAVVAQRTARQTDPDRLSRALVERASGDPALERDLLGTSAGLAERTLVEARNFLDTQVAGGPWLLTVVGPVAPERLLPAVRAAFPNAQHAASAPPTPTRGPGPVQLAHRMESARVSVSVGFPLPPLTGRACAAADLLATTLAPAVVVGPAQAAPGADQGNGFLIVTRSGPTREAALGAVVQAVTRLAFTGPGDDGLRETKARTVGQHARETASSGALAAWLAAQWRRDAPFTGPDAVVRWQDAVDSVSRAELQALAARLPPADAVVVAAVGAVGPPVVAASPGGVAVPPSRPQSTHPLPKENPEK